MKENISVKISCPILFSLYQPAVIQNILIVGLVTIGNGFVGLYQMTSLASGAAQCPGTTAGAAADASVSPMVASVSS